jgi:acetyl coenzyme A synthetase (ADP forming)-like protein
VRVVAPSSSSLDAPADVLVLRDGSVAAVRRARPGDRDAIRQFFRDLSPESRYRRFFSAGEPSDLIIDRLCAPEDREHGITLLATRAAGSDERLLGMVSYIPISAADAEVAFAVDDHFGGLGIATGLLERLVPLASHAGFERFHAETLAENTAMLDVFRDSGFMIRSKSAGGSIDVELALKPSEEGIDAHDRRERVAIGASIRPLLAPRAVAVVGVSRERTGMGRRIFDAIGAAGFEGPIYAVNPHTDAIDRHHVYRSARDLPAGTDLAVIAVPRDGVLAAIDDCAAAHVKSLVVISAGFAEAGDEGRQLQQRLLANVRGHGMRMIGPNCMGVLNAPLRLNASFSPMTPPAGRVAFSSQSGALGLTILALANERGVGLSTFVSVGNKADVSGNDLLQYWEDDPATSTILLYLESFGNPRRFGRLARRIGRQKPIVALKAGRTAAGRRAAGSHTAALAASETAVDALFRQAGVVRAETIDEMFDVAACFDAQPLPSGRRVAIVTNAGGPGILAVDACEAAGLMIGEFSAATRQRLSSLLPVGASVGNPVDMIASAGPDQYRTCIEAVLHEPDIDALIVIHTPVDFNRAPGILAGIRAGIADGRSSGVAGKPVLACLMAEAGHPLPLEAAGEWIPTYRFPENAARALGKVAEYATWRAAKPGLFWSFSDIDVDAARRLCREVIASRGDNWLTAEELRRVCAAFGLPLVAGVVARTAEDATALAAVAGFPVAMKLNAGELLHKSDVGGVRLGLDSVEAVRAAFLDLSATANALKASTDGVIIQPMIADGTEVIVGVVEDRRFGPIVGVGLGGIFVEAIGDVHFRLAPLTNLDASQLLREMRGFPVLDGVRGRRRADVDALEELVLRVSRLAEDVPEIVELDLNPVIVLAAGHGCRIVDARMRVAPPI